jgi:hypothetical protein
MKKKDLRAKAGISWTSVTKMSKVESVSMDVKSVKEKLTQVLEDPENDVKYQNFINDYTMLLEAVKINADTANMAIEAVNLDYGVNFLDTFAALTQK